MYYEYELDRRPHLLAVTLPHQKYRESRLQKDERGTGLADWSLLLVSFGGRRPGNSRSQLEVSLKQDVDARCVPDQALFFICTRRSSIRNEE
jgi:hypothetical protein